MTTQPKQFKGEFPLTYLILASLVACFTSRAVWAQQAFDAKGAKEMLVCMLGYEFDRAANAPSARAEAGLAARDLLKNKLAKLDGMTVEILQKAVDQTGPVLKGAIEKGQVNLLKFVQDCDQAFGQRVSQHGVTFTAEPAASPVHVPSTAERDRVCDKISSLGHGAIGGYVDDLKALAKEIEIDGLYVAERRRTAQRSYDGTMAELEKLAKEAEAKNCGDLPSQMRAVGRELQKVP